PAGLGGNGPSGSSRSFVEIRIHFRRRAGLGELLLEHFADPRLLVVVLDLIAPGFDILVDFGDVAEALAEAVFNAAQTRRQIARAGGAGVEVLVPHHRRRREHAAVLPVVALGLLAVAPEKREAFAF